MPQPRNPASRSRHHDKKITRKRQILNPIPNLLSTLLPDSPSIQYIQDLSPTDRSLLTQLLCLPQPPATTSIPPAHWLASQATLLSTFPVHLLRPKAFLPNLALSLGPPFTTHAGALLCATHKPLNPILIRRLWSHIAAEASLHVQNVVRARERDDERTSVAPQLQPELDSEVRAWLKRLQSLESLWMAPELYRVAYDVQPQEPRFEPVRSECEACILAVIGGNVAAVTDLRTSLLGRRKRGWTSMVWEFVDSWAGWTGCGDEVRAESERLGAVVRRVVRRERGRVRVERRGRRYRLERRRGEADGYPEEMGGRGCETSGGLCFENSIGMGDRPSRPGDHEGRYREQEQRFESSLKDHYKTLSRIALSRPDGANTGGEEGLHAAFRETLGFDAPSGTFKPCLSKNESRQPIGLGIAIPQTDGTGNDTYQFARDYIHLDNSARPRPRPKPQLHSSSIYSHKVSAGGSRAATQAPSARLATHLSQPRIPHPSTFLEDQRRAEQRAISYQRLVGGPEPSSPTQQEQDAYGAHDIPFPNVTRTTNHPAPNPFTHPNIHRPPPGRNVDGASFMTQWDDFPKQGGSRW